MKAKNGLFVVTLLATWLLLSGLSAACFDVTYTYRGNNFTDFKNTSAESQLFSTYDYLSLSFTVSDYLDTGGVFQDVDPGAVTFWQMTAGTVTFGSIYGDVIDSFGVAVTGSSVPSSWGISGIRSADSASSYYTFGGSFSPGDPSDQVVMVYPYPEEGSSDVYAVNSATVFSSPGVWSVSSDSAPVPIPAALPLLGSGIVTLGLLRRRTSRYFPLETGQP